MRRLKQVAKGVDESNWRIRADQLYETLKKESHSKQIEYLTEFCDEIKDARLSQSVEHDVFGKLKAFSEGRAEGEVKMDGNRHITKITVLAIGAAIVFALIGLVFVFAQPFGQAKIDAWGFSITTTHMGLASLALSVILVIKVSNNAFGAINKK